ncbi:MAG: ATP-dependent DNA helicase RecG [Planctomycetota bacterium]|jgi:ATP-dependent DNA helicase RecG
MSRTDPIELLTPVEDLPGVSESDALSLRSMGLRCAAHLIAHLPMRYEREEAEAPMGSLTPGEIVTARGEITDTRVMRFGRRKRFELVMEDPTGRLLVHFFNQPYLQKKLHPGMRLRVTGRAKEDPPYITLANPTYEILDDNEPLARDATIRPVYPATESLNSRRIESIITPMLDPTLAHIEDHLPEAYRVERSLPDLRCAYRTLHKPSSLDETTEARRRLVYDELFLLQLAQALRRTQRASTHSAPALRWDERILERIEALFPFELTGDQRLAISTIAHDLQRPTPMHRLLQGDVGAGKTLVALAALLTGAASGHQGALLAPTEILAEQHFQSISRTLEHSKLSIELLTGSLPPSTRDKILSRVASGDVDLVVGTHSLLSEGVSFRSLAVAVIDEQHRFGVHQRAVLQEHAEDSGLLPHTLVMTATPIPRTLALTVFGDLDVTTLREMPPGRSPVETIVLDMNQTSQADTIAAEHVSRRQQVYVVVPMIEGGEDALLRDVATTRERLAAGTLSHASVEVLHGRMKSEERNEIMERFRAGQIDCLVATTVIEVGVDVSNATLVIVEHAERFGLAQLHQLRGRVGRGTEQSTCVLLTQTTTEDATRRLDAMAESTDGFVIAERDLEIRGIGQIVGTRQSGRSGLKLAVFPDDFELLQMARRDAQEWIAQSPRLSRPLDTLLRSRLMKAHGSELETAGIA